MSSQLAELTDEQITLIARYAGVPAEQAARIAGVPVGFVRRARAALGRCIDTGLRVPPAPEPDEDREFGQIERLMRTNRGVRL